MYQKCPVCNGLGTETSYMNIGKLPINVPSFICRTCKGTGIVSELTGLPPKQENQNKGKDIDFSKVIENDLEK